MKYYTDTLTTPVGPFSIALDETGALAATAFGDFADLRTRLPHSAQSDCHLIRDNRSLLPARNAVADQIAAYFAGTRHEFTVRIAPVGTSFQQKIWATLRAIPYGETRSYGALARALASSPRAVGRANATNPICLLVPCHRVIGADGALTGFAFGEDVKRRLLAHEGAAAVRAA